MVAVGEAVRDKKPWVSEEFASMFDVHHAVALAPAEEAQLLKSVCAGVFLLTGAACEPPEARRSH